MTAVYAVMFVRKEVKYIRNKHQKIILSKHRNPTKKNLIPLHFTTKILIKQSKQESVLKLSEFTKVVDTEANYYLNTQLNIE